jgi:predicted DNA-binding protein YlxM (UPF0122 family)
LIYIPEVKKRIEKLKPSWESGPLNQREYREFCYLINKVVRKARERGSAFLDPANQPENFLLDLFKSKISRTVNKFLNKYPKESDHKKDWVQDATTITKTIILGDSTDRYDRKRKVEGFLCKFDSSENKHLSLNYKPVKAHKDWLLGQGGTHKKPHSLKVANALSTNFDWDNPWEGFECDGTNNKGSKQPLRAEFLIKDFAAISAAETFACKYKMPTDKNPRFDEPTGYDPDYKPPELRDLLADFDHINIALEMWEDGEYWEGLELIASKKDFINRLEKSIGMTLIDLRKRIITFPLQEPSLVGYLFGSKDRPGILYWRIDYLYKYRKSKNKKEIYEHQLSIGQRRDETDYDNSDDKPFSIEKAYSDKNECLPDIIENKDLQDKRREEIESILTAKQWQVYQMRFIERRSISEIAKKLNKTHRNIYKHISKIQTRIKANKEHFKEKNLLFS